MKRWALWAAIGLWFAGVVAAFLVIWNYKTTPGDDVTAPGSWPAASVIARVPGVANVVMFAHPQCPCTRASIAELARLATELGPRAQIHVVIVRPDGTDEEFVRGVIAERASAIRGARIVVDVDGVESERFGAIVSGSTVVYSSKGELMFRGGLTTARGHEGSGPAQARIRELVVADMGQADAPTFGCAIEETTRSASR